MIFPKKKSKVQKKNCILFACYHKIKKNVVYFIKFRLKNNQGALCPLSGMSLPSLWRKPASQPTLWPLPLPPLASVSTATPQVSSTTVFAYRIKHKTGISNEPFAWILPIDPKQKNVYSNDSGIVYHTTQPINSSPKPDKRCAKVPWATMSIVIVPKPERLKLVMKKVIMQNKKRKKERTCWEEICFDIYIDQPKTENSIKKEIPYYHLIKKWQGQLKTMIVYCSSFLPLTTRMIIVKLVAQGSFIHKNTTGKGIYAIFVKWSWDNSINPDNFYHTHLFPNN